LDIFTYEKWTEASLPEFQVREHFVPHQLMMIEGQTSPPSLLTEADLIALMDKNGIGTDATIHEHINKILEREYIIKEGTFLKPSALGCALVEAYDTMSFDASLAKPFLRAQVCYTESSS
jgi:DNA topoisomerase-3